MSINSQREFELLKKIGFVRTSGSKEELKAANILLEEISSIGCRGQLEDFKVPTSNIKKAILKVIEPYEKEYDITPYNCSISTPIGGITTDFVYIEDGLDANLIDLKGKFVLINMGPDPKLYKKLIKAGIAGYITMCGNAMDEESKTDISVNKMREKNTKHGIVPAITIRMKDGFHMLQNKASKVTVELITEDIELPSQNVVVTLEGTKYPDEIISFGAHYDSTPFSTGVYDNGAGSVIIMELLRHFKENPPIRTLKFVWYGSEEVGLLGSKAYLKDHEEELEKHLLMINVDVAGSILGREMALVTAEQSLIDYIDHMAKINGFPLKVEQSVYSSDSTAFADAGIPALTFCRFAPNGGAFIHSRNDVMEFLSAEALEKTSIITKEFSKSIVNSVVFPIERKIPDNMKKELDKYFGKEPEKDAAVKS
ncbi:M28 family peptidase [Clostridium sp. CS001]|uniref:M28 family metallopeptidase n=1 Tax=Clostridium sp. CS001 TaxID=2880648 RepID=UPI001CF551BF|nr:M28 family peptidase [Clostridium sp. CS001]MCB2290350.1 M28 family peptidase [Clostridium sp. CS001]